MGAMRLLADHPIVVGLPIAAAMATLGQLSLGLSFEASALAAFASFLLIQVFALRVARASDKREQSRRASALTSRLDGVESALVALQSNLQTVVQSSEAKADQRNQRLVREMKMIEDLVAQMARPKAKAVAEAVAAQPMSSTALPAEPEAPPEPVLRPIETLSGPELLEVIQSALEDNRIDLYLQPIVSLPQRKVKYYEALARLRSLDGELIEPNQYEPAAIAQGFMPIIDNLLLFRCVQIVRRIAVKSARRGIFCRISPHSLVDMDFFPQFLDFMRENVALKDLLVFELARGTLDLAGTQGEANIEALAELGFTFALGASEDLKVDLPWLRRRNFRFVKVSATLFVRTERVPDAQIMIDNFMTRLERQGIDLIIDGIQTEATILPVLEHDVALGEGKLFGGPRPIRRDLLAEGEDGGTPKAPRRRVP